MISALPQRRAFAAATAHAVAACRRPGRQHVRAGVFHTAQRFRPARKAALSQGSGFRHYPRDAPNGCPGRVPCDDAHIKMEGKKMSLSRGEAYILRKDQEKERLEEGKGIPLAQQTGKD